MRRISKLYTFFFTFIAPRKKCFNIDGNTRTMGWNAKEAKEICLLTVPLFQEILLFDKNGSKDEGTDSREFIRRSLSQYYCQMKVVALKYKVNSNSMQSHRFCEIWFIFCQMSPNINIHVPLTVHHKFNFYAIGLKNLIETWRSHEIYVS